MPMELANRISRAKETLGVSNGMNKEEIWEKSFLSEIRSRKGILLPKYELTPIGGRRSHNSPRCNI